MISDLDCALLCYSTYFNTAIFDKVIDGQEDDDVFVAYKNYPDCSVIAFRGTNDLLDVERDVKADMITDPDLGDVEAGFMIGIRKAFDLLFPSIDFSRPIYITGHSLGAARAFLFAGLCVLKGKDVRIVAFGSPRPASVRLKAILAPLTYAHSYKQGFDPVTNVPLSFGEDPYCHPRDMTPVHCEPISPDPWGPVKDHRIHYYIAALALKERGFS